MDHNTRLSSSEIGGLWSTYQQEKMSVCFLTYFLHQTQDNEVKNLIRDALDISQSHIHQIEELFIEEDIPVPHGFSDHDIDLSVPPL
ncbi:DUF3231 family protein [Ammoniphilus sp. CFH 90114]|uniref:DUF3231 family protein n=1 Tax=Ammoniphilus sp. CFH 90114 TaxID=2493665 RepID=UPI001F0BE354|nr:DUF3231 family protein [Ammoniphilus sp. CFH 90114]